MRTQKVIGIYCIKNIINNKVYIGSSKNIHKRWSNHKYNFKRFGTSVNPHLESAFKKYGINSFTFSILEVCNLEELEIRENYWMNTYNSRNNNFGYNINIAGNIPPKFNIRDNKSKPKGSGCKLVFVCINKITGQVIYKTSHELIDRLGITYKSLTKCSNYWENKTDSNKSWHDYIFVKYMSYKPDFDYINYKKPIIRKPKEKLIKHKTLPKPYHERNIFRRAVCVENIITGEQTNYFSITDCVNILNLKFNKVSVVLKAPFKERKHRGYYIKYL